MRKRLVIVIAAVLVLVLGLVGYAERGAIRSYLDQVTGKDYAGSGTCCVTVEVAPGDTGDVIANKLQAAGAIKSADLFYRLVLSKNPTFYPGKFRVNKEASSLTVLGQITDVKNLVVTKVTVKEGLRIGTVLRVLSDATGVSLSDFETAAKDLPALGIPATEPSAEGYLFPATYDFDPDLSAAQILKIMVDRMYQDLDNAGVAKADRHKVLTLASIIQKEARQTQDFYKVSRVFTNRLKIGMLLQSDATVSYGSGGTTVSTTNAERADRNGYNTYVHVGLPIGPISAPGALAIDAALHPATGDWLYFCAVNLATGETVFSVTIAEHEKAVAQWRQWMKENPGWNGN